MVALNAKTEAHLKKLQDELEALPSSVEQLAKRKNGLEEEASGVLNRLLEQLKVSAEATVAGSASRTEV